LFSHIDSAACAALACGFETSFQMAANLVARELLVRIDLRLGPHVFGDQKTRAWPISPLAKLM